MKKLKELLQPKADERQRQDLLQIEHNGYWFTYWLLFAGIFYQIAFTDHAWERITGEWLVFMASSLYIVIGCMRKGVWGYRNKKVPGIRGYLLYSLIGAVVFGSFIGFIHAIRFQVSDKTVIFTRIVTVAASLFVLLFVSYLIVGSITGARAKKLARMAEEDENDDEEEMNEK